MSAICNLYVVTVVKAGRPVAPIKIGISTNARARARNLQTSSPLCLELLFAFDMPSTQDALLAEAEAHHALDRFRLQGEWFDFPPEHALHLCSSIAALVAGGGHTGAAFLRASDACGCAAADRLAAVLWPAEPMGPAA